MVALGLAGCGGSGNRSSGSAITNPAVQAQVAQCEATINAQPVLSESIKRKLVAGCVAVARGDKATARRIAAQTCVEVIDDAVPPAERKQALKRCPKP
jgi:alkylation response protein AidB-like acyl-CoA dehydrogenase